MKLSKTIKQFLATMLAAAMIVTTAPFVPVALGISDKVANENVAYADSPSVPANPEEAFTEAERSVPLYFKADYKHVGTTIDVKLAKEGSPDDVYLKYAITSSEDLPADDQYVDYVIGSTISLNVGNYVYFRASEDNATFSKSDKDYYHFIFDNYAESGIKVLAGGNIMSLLYTDFSNKFDLPCEYVFTHLFEKAYALQSSPILPATELTEYCYAYMFWLCKNLKTPVSILPALHVKSYSYQGMFKQSASITASPILAAATVDVYAYAEMFRNCTKLQRVEVYFESWILGEITSYWLEGVSKTGTFVCIRDLDYNYNIGIREAHSVIPSGWTIEYNVPSACTVTLGGVVTDVAIYQLKNLFPSSAANNKKVEVKLNRDVRIYTSINVGGTGTRVFDLNGHTMSGSFNNFMLTCSTSNVTLEIINSAVNVGAIKQLYSTSSDSAGVISVTNGCRCTIADNIEIFTSNTALELKKVNMTISGGTYEGNKIDINTASNVTITGGKFLIKSPLNSTAYTIKGGYYSNSPSCASGYIAEELQDTDPLKSEGYNYRVIQEPKDVISKGYGLAFEGGKVIVTGPTTPSSISVFDSSNTQITEGVVDNSFAYGKDTYTVKFQIGNNKYTLRANCKIVDPSVTVNTSDLDTALSDANAVRNNKLQDTDVSFVKVLTENHTVSDVLSASSDAETRLSDAIANATTAKAGCDQIEIDRAEIELDNAKNAYVSSVDAQMLKLVHEEDGYKVTEVANDNIAIKSVSMRDGFFADAGEAGEYTLGTKLTNVNYTFTVTAEITACGIKVEKTKTIYAMVPNFDGAAYADVYEASKAKIITNNSILAGRLEDDDLKDFAGCKNAERLVAIALAGQRPKPSGESGPTVTPEEKTLEDFVTIALSDDGIHWKAEAGVNVKRIAIKDENGHYMPLQMNAGASEGDVPAINTKIQDLEILVETSGISKLFNTTAAAIASFDSPAVVVFSASVGVYTRGLAGITSISYAKGDYSESIDSMFADDLAGNTNIVYVAPDKAIDKQIFDKATPYTFCFNTAGNPIIQVVTIK